MTTVKALQASIDQYPGAIRRPAYVSLDAKGLAEYLLVSLATARELESRGLIKSVSATHRNDPEGRRTFSSVDLNALRSAVLTEIVGGVIDFAANEDEILPAARRALHEHVKNFSAKPKQTVELSRDDEDEPGTVRKAVGVAGAVAGAYGAASFIRGRSQGASVLSATGAGHRANVATARKVGDWYRPRARLVAAKGASFLDTASAALRARTGR